MNIVKFKDVILTEKNAPHLTPAERNLFNTKFRGRYTYAVNWSLCYPLEEMTEKEYIQLSKELSNDPHRHITWMNGDELLSVSIVPYNTMPEYTGPTPTKDETPEHVYVFDGWTPALEPATEDITYYAHFAEEPHYYTVRWHNYDGEIIKTDLVAYGETPVYVGEEPTKPSTPQYHYNFIGWEPSTTPIFSEKDYYAQFVEVVNEYTIKFVDDDGVTVLQQEVLPYGSEVEYYGEDPTKQTDWYYSYDFDGWDKKIEDVTEDTTYTATYYKTALFYYPEEEVTISALNPDDVSFDMLSAHDYNHGMNRWAKWKIYIPDDENRVYSFHEYMTTENIGNSENPLPKAHAWRIQLLDKDDESHVVYDYNTPTPELLYVYGTVIFGDRNITVNPSQWIAPEAKEQSTLVDLSNITPGYYILKIQNIEYDGMPMLLKAKFVKE